MMKKLKPIEVKALTILLKSSKGLDAFSYFRRLDASFPDFSKTLRTLCKLGLINEGKEDFFEITSEGTALVMQKELQQRKRPWRDVPKEFLGTKMSTSDFYVPSVSLLDKKSFKSQ
ncbi:hypothetical protein LRP50_14455 [Enterovibrio sp. ZSDZ42]|uniref:Uncharacterized protein n=1 Tax=Enterovibrio gelatinilyticus TaxID=2899819 RepID=A0ABT5R4A4_9GAMM|nr:hypothetical protein [Enterovibrio sp. ZSDZ42]MDD1794337.1 hypothetical protein [Enterovibrio sp. ZSDZ42]